MYQLVVTHSPAGSSPGVLAAADVQGGHQFFPPDVISDVFGAAAPSRVCGRTVPRGARAGEVDERGEGRLLLGHVAAVSLQRRGELH